MIFLADMARRKELGKVVIYRERPIALKDMSIASFGSRLISRQHSRQALHVPLAKVTSKEEYFKFLETVSYTISHQKKFILTLNP